MICDRWQVVAVPFPFMERPASKRRPALVLSNKRFNLKNGHSVLAMITTAKGTAWPSDVPIRFPKVAGLSQPCTLRFKLFTLPNDFIARLIGELSPKDRGKAQAGWLRLSAG